MLDNIREWISDNLRYILLGLAAILIGVIVFFAVRLIQGLGSPKTKQPETQQASTETMTEDSQHSSSSENRLQLNQEDILNLMTQYYTARAAKDYDTLTSLSESFDDEEKNLIETKESVVESYSNIKTYSKDGPSDGTYVVYTYLEAKLTAINTPAPMLKEVYVVTNADDKLVVGDATASTEAGNYVLARRSDDDVQNLIKDVEQMMDTAKANDEDLKNYVESNNSSSSGDGNTAGGNEDGSGDSGSGDNSTASGTTMKATTGVNVRGAESADSTLYGTLYAGQEVEVLENLSSGWSKIRYTANGTTIEGYVMTQYLGAAQ